MNKTPRIKVNTRRESWPISGSFAISRGAKTQAEVVVVELTEGAFLGHGECVPYARYGESVEGVLAAIEAMAPALATGLGRDALQRAMPAGAARNALDCALWDLDAKRSGRPAYAIAGLSLPRPLPTAFTISIGTPEDMARATQAALRYPQLKVKLGAIGDPARIAAVRSAAPRAELIVDANEGWTTENIAENFAACVAAGVTLIEQPLPAHNDALLATITRPIPICADESAHDTASLDVLAGKYDFVNIKLDKTGGLTQALTMATATKAKGFGIMVGSMVGTSLAMAPAMLLAQYARVVDLDGPLLLAKDRPNGLRYDGSTMYPPEPALWG
jgi:L-alanine-DL-glutamate epimerase-like enolase superfamily enzyme